MNFIIKAALSYLDKHPDQVEILIDELIHSLIAYLRAQKPAA